MSTSTYVRLSVMMFLQFFIWGAWFVTLGTHLGSIGFTGSQIGYAYLMNNIAAIVSPFFVGMIADRFFASQKVMAVLHLLGGFLMYFSSDLAAVTPLIAGLLLYNLAYMPTLALVNAVSFNQMANPDKQFPKVRVWGTLGWIVAGLVITFVLANYVPEVEKSAVPMKMAAIASILLGLYSFTLPNTPPQNVKAAAMNMNPKSIPVLVCAFGLLAAFFMPWVQSFGVGISGYNLGQLGSYGNYAWVIPLLAGVTILLSFTPGVNNRGIGVVAGIVPLGAILYGLIRLSAEGGRDATTGVLKIAGQVLSIGAWLTVIFSTAIIIAAAVQTRTATSPKDSKSFIIGEVLGLNALRLLKERNFLVFVLCSLFISIPLAFYYNFTNLFLNEIGMEGAAAKQSMGQMSEVLFMVLMPWFFVRLGVRKMLLVGMLAWVLRYALFAMGNLGALVGMLYLGILLHGVCYDFFFVTGQIYVDKKASKEIRASAQGFIAFITYGIGIGLGSVLSGKIVDAFTADNVRHWGQIWWVPCAFAAVIALFFALTFKNEAVERQA